MASNNTNNDNEELPNEQTHSNEQPLNEELPNEQVPLPQEQPPTPNEQLSSSVEIIFDDETCPVCLGPHVNKSRPNCGHVFCYQCLVDWCRIKLECPLCKQGFTFFRHSFQSPDNYQVYTPPPIAEDPLREFLVLLDAPEPNRVALSALLMDANDELRMAFLVIYLLRNF